MDGDNCEEKYVQVGRYRYPESQLRYAPAGNVVGQMRYNPATDKHERYNPQNEGPWAR